MGRTLWHVLLLVATAALVAVVGLGLRVGQDAARIAALKQSLDSLEAVGARIDTVYTADTIPFWRTKRQWDTLRVAHLERVLDSLRGLGIAKPETVQVSVPVSVLVTADSAITTCQAAVLTCEQRVANRDARIAKLDTLNRDLERAAAARQVRTAVQSAGVAILGWEALKLLLGRK